MTLHHALRLVRRHLPRLICALALATGLTARAQATPGCPPVAQAPTADQVQAGMRAARDHGFLWRIGKDGRSSYLFGTLHVAKLAWAFPGPKVMQALSDSDTIALELDLLDPDVMRRLTEGMSALPGTTLPAPLARRIADQASVECLPPQALAALAPELQVVTLMTLVARHDGLDPAYGIDMLLSDWAHAVRKTVVSLESPELQLRALLIADTHERLEFVASALDELESGRARPQLLRVAQVWAVGDLSTLARYEDWCECMKTPADRAAMARVLDERNPALAEGIDALHASGARVFAAVGSLHMIGPRGLPALLAQRGYRVERITAGAP
jgi:uncharacterized protein YbaP (TraB family)